MSALRFTGKQALFFLKSKDITSGGGAQRKICLIICTEGASNINLHQKNSFHAMRSDGPHHQVECKKRISPIT
jgi:hypothetical protein